MPLENTIEVPSFLKSELVTCAISKIKIPSNKALLVISKIKITSAGLIQEKETKHVHVGFRGTLPVVYDKKQKAHLVLNESVLVEAKAYKQENTRLWATTKEVYDEILPPFLHWESVNYTFSKERHGNHPMMKYIFGVETISDKILENKNYTLGIEFETSEGHLINSDYLGLNLKCVRDMSITSRPDLKNSNGEYVREYCGSGGEYVTGVLKGDHGFNQIQKILSKLNQNCKVNSSCSLHVHVGGEKLSFSKEFIVASYKLGMMIEKEMFSTMPPSREKSSYCKGIQKLNLDLESNVSKEETDIIINNYYISIFKIMSGRVPDKEINKNRNHPAGPKLGYNKNTPRYWWLNFIPAMFNTKGGRNYTLEFRSHSGTLNYFKTKNWILFCSAFVYVAENHWKTILLSKTFTMDQILDIAYSANKSAKLKSYFQERKNHFKKTEEKKEYEEINQEDVVSIKNLIKQ
jgi:hypothetical protein